MERKLDATSAETVAEPLANGQTGPVTPPSTSSKFFSSSTSIPDEGRFVPGTMLNGRYRVLGLLGQGGMGEVYRATDLTLGQSVALKFLPEAAAGNVRLLERFHGEVRVARQVSHPNVCRVYDIGEAEGLPFISMEYIDGEDLASLLQRIGRLPSDKALETARKVCAGLAAAHDKGVIHRDLKPHNIMLNKRGEVVIMDFGLAAVAHSLSGAEARNGTPAYMSPEQLKGAEVTAKSDIYALGLVLFELFTGKRPYEAKSLQALIDLQEAQQLTSMTAIANDVDPLVEKAIRQCLDPDPAKRPHTPLAVSAALPGGDPLAAALAAGETPSPEMVASAGKTEGLDRRWALLCLVVIVASILSAPWWRDLTSAMGKADLPYSPEVLGEKSREIAARLGYPNRPRDFAVELAHREDYRDFLNKRPGEKRWQEWLSGESSISSWYRESPKLMAAAPFGDLSPNTPPFREPGMTMVRLDGLGRLREFEAIPYEKGAESGGPVSAEGVFQAMGFDISKFSEAMPAKLPKVPADQLRAWTGSHPKLPDVNMQIEVGWWRNQVTYVNIQWPWTKKAEEEQKPSPMSRARNIIMMVLTIGLALFGLLLAVRNWRSGRVDKNGAFRLGMTFAFCQFLIWAGSMHPAGFAESLPAFVNTLGTIALGSGAIWGLYLALEPPVRSRWPHALVTWNRLLAGRFTDPQVCAHALIGAAAGMAVVSAGSVTDVWKVAHAGLEGGGFLYSTLGAREWTAVFGMTLTSAMSSSLIFMFLLFGVRVILRKDWLAALVTTILFAITNQDIFSAPSPIWQVDLAITLVVVGGLITVLLRLGMVAMSASVFFINALARSPLGLDLKTWYAPAGLTWLALLLVVTLYLFYFSLGSRTLLGTDPHK